MVCSIRESFLTVDGYIMDEHPEHSLHLSKEPAVAGSNAVGDGSSHPLIGRLPRGGG